MGDKKVDKEIYKLVYINKVGTEWDGDNLYEFLFSDDHQNVEGDFWDLVPSSGQAKPPHKEFINLVGKLNTKLKLKLVQESDTFAYWDSVDGIVSIAWEDIDGYDEYPNLRLHFNYGDDITEVTDKLYEIDLTLTYNKKINVTDSNN